MFTPGKERSKDVTFHVTDVVEMLRGCVGKQMERPFMKIPLKSFHLMLRKAVPRIVEGHKVSKL